MEESVDCTADYVVIRDGKDNNATLIGNYIKKEIKRQKSPFEFLGGAEDTGSIEGRAVRI